MLHKPKDGELFPISKYYAIISFKGDGCPHSQYLIDEETAFTIVDKSISERWFLKVNNAVSVNLDSVSEVRVDQHVLIEDQWHELDEKLLEKIQRDDFQKYMLDLSMNIKTSCPFKVFIESNLFDTMKKKRYDYGYDTDERG